MARRRGEAVYRAVAAEIRDRIIDGTYPPGSTLPHERLLIEEFGANRAIMTRAFQLLVSEGWIYGRQGRGRYVREVYEQEPVDLAVPLVDGSATVVTDVTSRRPTSDEAERWDLLPGVSVMEVVHRWLDEDGAEVERQTRVLPADRFKLHHGPPEGQES